MRANFKLQRLFIDAPLSQDGRLALSREHANYLMNVLRLKDGASVLVFNGRDGEWCAELMSEGRKKASLTLMEPTRPQPDAPPLSLLFAPIKVGRLEYMVQKMTEMGAGHIRPVLTDHTQLHKLNLDRLNANIIEAAELCGVLHIPRLHAPQKLGDFLDQWGENECLIFCDEGEARNNPLPILQGLKGEKISLLIGPEGGFSEQERTRLKAMAQVTSIPLGPRILRADTALVAAMAIVQAAMGDWE